MCSVHIMNTTVSYSSEPSWSRRCSTETIFSIQGKETDFVQDTSDTEWDGVEYEPVTEPEEDGALPDDSSGASDNEIIQTKVIEVVLNDEGSLLLADAEPATSSSDSELDLHDYWLCAHCRNTNNNPLYRYCEKCFKVRKNLFPPRPTRRRKKLNTRLLSEITPDLPRTLSQDSGVESAVHSQDTPPLPKRTRESADTSLGSDSETDLEPKRRRVSETVKVHSLDAIGRTPESDDGSKCIICCSEPKSGVFVHGRVAHICCCYRCAIKVWSSARRCPVCNCRVSNVLRAVVM